MACGPAGHTETMRAIWKGAVSFGLVSVPVKLYSATESHDVSFRQVHAKDGGRIKYQRVCSLDGEEVAYADIAKGYETEDGEMVILTDDDMAELPSTSSREISVEKFVPSDQIDPMLFEKSYYLEPEKTGAKPYALLRQALAGRRPDGGRDRRAAPADDGRGAPRARRRDRAADDDVARRGPHARLLRRRPARSSPPRSRWPTCSSRPWPATSTPSEFEDDYAEAVEALVKAKIEGGEVKRTATSTKSSGEVVDLLAALQRSRRRRQDRPRRGRAERRREAGEEVPGQEGREEGARQEGRGEEVDHQEDAGQEGQLGSRPPASNWSRSPHLRSVMRLVTNRKP